MIYSLLEDFLDTSVLGCWEKHLLHFKKIVGYSATGSIFLMSPESREHLVFYPSMPSNNAKNYGVFESLDDFRKDILEEPSFPEYCLYPIKPNDLDVLEANLGPLEAEQIYYPKLDPALGGSLELDQFDKGNIWIRTEILGLNRGIE